MAALAAAEVVAFLKWPVGCVGSREASGEGGRRKAGRRDGAPTPTIPPSYGFRKINTPSFSSGEEKG